MSDSAESGSFPPVDGIETEDTDEDLLEEHRSIPEPTREEAFADDRYRCQVCGCLGGEDGSATLLAQRLLDYPASSARNDIENIVTRCQVCAQWVSQLPGRETLSPVLQERLSGIEIESTWAEILEYLEAEGPASPAAIRDAVSLTSTGGIRHGLYQLMALDRRHEAVEAPLVIKDQRTDQYGLPWQIPDTRWARGTIPVDPARRQSRILDALVARLDTALVEYTSVCLEAAKAGSPGQVNPDDLATDRLEIIGRAVDREASQVRKMLIRADGFAFPFDEWAAAKRERASERAVADAVKTIARSTENLSRTLLSDVLAETFQTHDETALATTLAAWGTGTKTETETDSSSGGSHKAQTVLELETDGVPSSPVSSEGSTPSNSGSTPSGGRAHGKDADDRGASGQGATPTDGPRYESLSPDPEDVDSDGTGEGNRGDVLGDVDENGMDGGGER